MVLEGIPRAVCGSTPGQGGETGDRPPTEGGLPLSPAGVAAFSDGCAGKSWHIGSLTCVGEEVFLDFIRVPAN